MPRRRRDADVATRDRELLVVLEGGFDRAARRAGDHLVCAPGCSDCCHGPFPITPLDVRRLREGLRQLEETDPPRAAALRCRAGAAVETLADGFPGDPDSGRVRNDLDELDRFFERHRALACPALDRSGRCELYAHRPVGCRDYGPPLLYDGEPAPPCPLCFNDATSDEIEDCRYTPDPTGLEGEILAQLVEGPDDEWQTLIAFVLAGDDPRHL